MSAIALPGCGIPWPYHGASLAAGTSATLDASGEKFSCIGRIKIVNPTTGVIDPAQKTLDTSGSSKIEWANGANCTFAATGSIFKVGLQGVLNNAGPIAVPDETYGAVGVFTKGTNDTTPAMSTDSSWITAVPTTGTSNVTCGDLIAVTFELNNNAGSDALTFQTTASPSSLIQHLPITNVKLGAGFTWGTSATNGAGQRPDVLITFSDGSVGYFEGSPLFGVFGSDSWANGGTDEKGLIFQVPFDCKVDALFTFLRLVTAGTSDATLSLYEYPEGVGGTIASIASIPILSEQSNVTGSNGWFVAPLASEVSLLANTDYCIALNADNTGQIRIDTHTLGSAAHRIFLTPAGESLRTVSRNTGNFSGSSTTLLYQMGVRISEISGFGGAGGGGIRMAGHGGLAA